MNIDRVEDISLVGGLTLSLSLARAVLPSRLIRVFTRSTRLVVRVPRLTARKSQLLARGNKLRDKCRVPAVKRGGGAAQCVETAFVVGLSVVNKLSIVS